MNPAQTPKRAALRLPLVTLVLLAVAAAVAAPGVGARPQMLRGTVVSQGSKPFTESVAQMRRRDLARRAANLDALISPAPWANPVHPKPPKKPLTQDPSQQVAEGFFPPSTAPTASAVGASFAGVGMQSQISTFGGWSWPPDTMGAVGPNHFVQVINGSLAIFNKSNGSLNSHITLNSFFTFTADSVSYPRNGAFDPRVIFDRKTGRWFVCALEFGTLANGFGTNNQLLLAVSRTSDPTGTFDKYALLVGEPTSGSTAGFTDYPTLGVDSNGVYAAVRIFTFNPNTGAFGASFAKLVATPLAPLVAGAPSLGTVTTLSNIQDMYSTPQPALNLDANDAASPAWFFASDGSSVNLKYRKVTWNAGTPTFSASATLSGISNASLNLPNAPALNSTTAINTGDIRVQSATIRNNRLWTARNVAVNSAGTSSNADRVACEWFEINVSTGTPSLVQNGRIFDTAVSDPRHYYYPTIMVNGQGHAVIGFSGSKSTEFVGAYYAGRLVGDVPGTMGEPVLLKAGTGSYVQLDSSDRNRWGDYSHTTLDPSDNMSLWTVQEYAETNGSVVNGTTSRWGTRVAKLLSLAPTLNAPSTVEVQRGNTGVTLNLTGTNFYDPGVGFTNRLAAQFTGAGAADLTNVVTTYNSPTSATVTFNVAANAAAGARGLTLVNPDGQSASVSNTVNVIVSATTSLDFSSATYSVAEGAGTATITVNRTGATSGTSTVTYATTSGGTAVAGSDYTATTNTLTFTAGQTSKTFDVPIANDTLLEASETVNLTLSSPTGGLLGSVSTAQLTISNNAATPKPTGLSATVLSLASISLAWTDNCGNETGYQVERKAGGGGFSLLTTANANATSAMDSGPFIPGTVYTYRVRAANGALTSDYSDESSAAITTLEFASATATVAEGAVASLTVNRTGDTSIAASVSVAASGGTAAPDIDFEIPSMTVTFGVGVTTRTVSVPARLDRFLEADEPAVFTLFSPTGAGVVLGAQSTNTLTITDNVDFTAPTGLSASVQSGSEIALSWTDNCDDEMGYEVERSTGGGFTLVATKAAGATSHVDAGLSRGVTYSYRVRAVRPGLASGYSNTASATIDAIQLSSGAFSVSETGVAVMITVNRTGSAVGQVTVDYATGPSTATDGADYTGVQGTLTFENTQTSKTVVIPVADDALIEGPEAFTFTLSNASGIGLGVTPSATVTITDNTASTGPTNLTATVMGAALVRLAWQDNSGNETGFRIERKVGAGTFATLATVGANVISYDDATVTQGTAHVYRVTAFAGAAESGVSNEATVTIATGGKAVITPKTLAFGKVKVGRSKLKTLKIKNTGRGVLQGTVGALDPRFAIEAGAGGFTLARNQTHVVRVRYTPTVAETISTILTITTTDPKKATVNVKTTAKGF